MKLVKRNCVKFYLKYSQNQLIFFFFLILKQVKKIYNINVKKKQLEQIKN